MAEVDETCIFKSTHSMTGTAPRAQETGPRRLAKSIVASQGSGWGKISARLLGSAKSRHFKAWPLTYPLWKLAVVLSQPLWMARHTVWGLMIGDFGLGRSKITCLDPLELALGSWKEQPSRPKHFGWAMYNARLRNSFSIAVLILSKPPSLALGFW